MAHKNAVEHVQEKYAKFFITLWLITRGRESSIMLDTFTRLFRLFESQGFFSRAYSAHPVDSPFYNLDMVQVRSWFENGEPVLDLWNYVRRRYKMEENPLGVLKFPARKRA